MRWQGYKHVAPPKQTRSANYVTAQNSFTLTAGTSGIELATSPRNCKLTSELIHLSPANKGDKWKTIHCSQMCLSI